MSDQRTSKKRNSTKKVDWKKAGPALASRVIWALKFLEGHGLVFHKETEEKGTTQTWQDWFFDSLDEIGYVVDRKLYWEGKEKEKKRRSRRG